MEVIEVNTIEIIKTVIIFLGTSALGVIMYLMKLCVESFLQSMDNRLENIETILTAHKDDIKNISIKIHEHETRITVLEVGGKHAKV